LSVVPIFGFDIRLFPQRYLSQCKEFYKALSATALHVASTEKLTDISLFRATSQQHDPLPLPPHPRGPPRTMTKHLGIRRRVVLYHAINVGQVESACGDVCAEEDRGAERGRGVGGECGEGGGAYCRGEVAVEGGKVES
jgi:hypothetical protein